MYALVKMDSNFSIMFVKNLVLFVISFVKAFSGINRYREQSAEK